MSNAIVELQLAGANQVLDQLMAVKRELEAIGMIGGGGVGSASSGGAFIGSADVATPTISPTGLSAAAQTAGTSNVGQFAAAGPSMSGAGASWGQNMATPTVMHQMGVPSSMYGMYVDGAFTHLSFDPDVGRWYNPSNQSYLLGGLNPLTGHSIPMYGGNGQPKPLPDKSNLQQLGEALGGAMAYQQIVGVTSQQAGAIGSAIATGAPYQPQSMVGGALRLGGTVFGAAVGTYFGAPMIGAAVGSAAGEVAGQFADPIANQSIANEHLARTYLALNGAGSNPSFVTPAAQQLQALALSGRPMSLAMGELIAGRDNTNAYGKLQRALDGMYGWFGLPSATEQLSTGSSSFNADFASRAGSIESGLARPGMEDKMIAAINKMAYSPAAIKALGRVAGQSGGSMSEIMQLLDAVKATDPSSVIEFAATMNRNKMPAGDLEKVDKMLDYSYARMVQQVQNESSISGYSSMLGSQMSLMSMSGPGVYDSAAQNSLGEVVRAKRSEADAIRKSDPIRAAAMDWEIASLEKQTNRGIFGVQMTDYQATVGLESGRASRALSRAEWGGRRYDDMPYDDQQRMFNDQATRLMNYANDARSRGLISQAEYKGYQSQAEDLHFQGERVARDREEKMRSTMMGETDLKAVSYVKSKIGLRIYGGAVDQAAGLEDEVAVLEMKRATIEKILEISKTLTYEQKVQLETQKAQLDVDIARTGGKAAVAGVQATLQVAMIASAENMTDARIPVLRGAGGWDQYAANDRQLGEARKQVQAATAAINDLSAKGFDYDSNEMRPFREQLNAAKEQEASLESSLMLIRPTAAQEAKMLTLGTERMAMQAGFMGGVGAVRENITAQMDVIKGQISDINRAAKDAKAKGNWNDENERNYNRQMADYTRQLIGLQQEYDEGFMERIIAQSINMGGGPGVTMSQALFNRRSASEAGVSTLHHGGNHDWLIKQMGRPLRMVNVASSATPGGATREGLSAAEINVKVVVEDANGSVIGRNSASLSHSQTVEVFTKKRGSPTD